VKKAFSTSQVEKSLAKPVELTKGDRLGPFELERVLGEGGMAVVYLARRGDDEPVALKLLKRSLTSDEVVRHRFANELRSAARVRHPNLVRIFDAGEIEGRPYAAEEYLPGATLEQRIRDGGALAQPDVVRMGEEVAAGLDALHEAGIVHRDLKSANILYRADGTAVLTDFGLARGRDYTVLTRLGQVLGTVEYIAPELILGEPATAASDVYAFGCTVYEAVAGRTPFGGYGPMRIGAAHMDEQPRDPTEIRPDCGPALARAVLLALAKEPRLRPLPATAYARALRAAVDADGR
jgi:serine/threonine protein kinase